MSETMFYYAEGSERRGPFTLHQLSSLNLAPDTLVWSNGLENWMPASQAPLTSHLFQIPPAGFGAPQPNPNNQAPYNNPQPFNPYNNMPPKPDSYLVWAILATLFCCLPLGVVSIVYAAKVDSLYSQGLYQQALQASQNAKKWAMWSALSCVILSALYLFFVFCLGVAMI